MLYQLRSKGVLIGHADLDYGEMEPRARSGDFYPNEAGAPLMPIFSEVTRVNRADRHARMARPRSDELPVEPEGWQERYADIMAAHHRAETLELELCWMDGRPIATEYITIRDMHEILELHTVHASDDGPYDPDTSFDESWRGYDEEDYEAELREHLASLRTPRYRICVELMKCGEIP